MNYTRIKTDSFFNGPLIWVLLFITAAFFRLLFIFKGNITFRSDDAILCDYLHKWGTPFFSDVASSWRIVDGVRLALGLLLDRLFTKWLYSVEIAAVFLNLLGCSLWVWFVHKRVSAWAALAMATALTLFPLSTVYYATVYERRLVTVLLSAVLALGSGSWSKNNWRMGSLGFLLAWGLWEEKLFILFIPAVLLAENWSFYLKTNIKKGIAFGIGVFGFLAGSFTGFSHSLQQSDFPESYLQYTFADLNGILKNIKLLLEAFPYYWTGHMPFGYLQASSLGLSLDPSAGSGSPIGLSTWTWVTMGFSTFSFIFAWQIKKGLRNAILILALPALLLIIFFVFSNQTWDAMSFRYFSYLTVYMAAGFGTGIYLLLERRRHWFSILWTTWLLGWGGLMFFRILTLPIIHPGEVIAKGLKRLDMKSGYANYWVSEVIRYQSRDELLFTPYNNHPFSWKAWQAAGQESRIGLIVVDGLDNKNSIEECLSDLRKSGYSLVKKWQFEEHWSVIELIKNKQKK